MAIPEENVHREGSNHQLLRRYIMVALGELRPSALRLILQMDLGVDNMPELRRFVKNLISSACHEFLVHARTWADNPDDRPLEIMEEYHMLWEGFTSDEPYFDSANQQIKYFMDHNRGQREREMRSQFPGHQQ